MSGYYKLPLRFDLLISEDKANHAVRQDLPKCKDLGESIFQNVHLILMTSFGEYRLDNSYGCSIWENDFENIVSINKWKEEMKGRIKDVIERHEPRLKSIKVDTNISESEIRLGGGKKSKIQRIKKLVEVRVSGKVVSTNEPFECVDRLYVSPLSLE